MKIPQMFFVMALVLTVTGTGETAVKNTKNPIVVILTELGNIEIELFYQEAPKTTENFTKKVQERYFDGTTFHRLVPQFVIQGGDPNSKDQDSSNDGYGGGQMDVEPRKLSNQKATIAMASSSRSQPITSQSDSQFFINLADNIGLDRLGFIPFGKVVKGLDIVERISQQKRDAQDRPLKNIVLKIRPK